MTREEILAQYRDDSKTPHMKGVWFQQKDALEAMGEYAKLTSCDLLRWIKESGWEWSAKDKLWFKMDGDNPNRLTDEEFYELYLQSKQ